MVFFIFLALKVLKSSGKSTVQKKSNDKAMSPVTSKKYEDNANFKLDSLALLSILHN